ncbi:MAG: hypothetical protein RIS70_2867 [Planctomycetota bacterium]|jgi:hypothetical protein
MTQHERGWRVAANEHQGAWQVHRRDFLRVTGAGAVAAGLAGGLAATNAGLAAAADVANPPETLVKTLFDSFNDAQRKAVCFDWDYLDPKRGLLRTRVSNNWQITEPSINSDFFTKDQQHLVRKIYEGIIDPSWHEKIDRQLKDDTGGKPFGGDQSLAVFGKPGDSKFEFVMTGRHMTLRCDGNSADHLAFGGPIFYGHAASGFNETPGHPGNVYWEQALAANKVYEMLDGKQRARAEVAKSPQESRVAFRGAAGPFEGIPVSELSSDQKELVQQVLKKLVEPYRQSDRDEVTACLKQQGGLDKCHLAFYTDEDLGTDRVWDNWRLEGPSFVWHFRGVPHVHVWVHVADSASVKLNAAG